MSAGLFFGYLLLEKITKWKCRCFVRLDVSIKSLLDAFSFNLSADGLLLMIRALRRDFKLFCKCQTNVARLSPCNRTSEGNLVSSIKAHAGHSYLREYIRKPNYDVLISYCREVPSCFVLPAWNMRLVFSLYQDSTWVWSKTILKTQAKNTLFVLRQNHIASDSENDGCLLQLRSRRWTNNRRSIFSFATRENIHFLTSDWLSRAPRQGHQQESFS